jgi:hypothetical protein
MRARVCCIALACLCWVSATPSSAQWTNVRVSDPGSTDPEEVVISIDPTNPLNLAAGANTAYYYFSLNGGHNWIQGELTSSLGVWGDPCVTFDALGNLYFAHLSWPKQAPGDWVDRIVVQKSTNGGVTWSDGVGVGHNPPKDEDKEWLTPDMTGSVYNNNLYMAWTEFDAVYSSDPSDSTRILFSYSTDQSANWVAPIRVSDMGGNCLDGDSTVEGAVPAVGPNGEVYLAWAGHGNIYFDKSLDGGVTWGSDIVIAQQAAGWAFDVPGIYYCNGLPVTLCDASNSPYRGNIYVVYSDQPTTDDTDVLFVMSGDGGATWTAPRAIVAESGPHHQFFPWAAIDPSSGYLYVDYYDRRYVGGDTTEVFMSISRDGGESWWDYRVSESAFVPVDTVFFGDYIGIAARDGRVYPIWTRMDGEDLSVWVALVDVSTGVDVAGTGAPPAITLEQNRPNPFNPSTEIEFDLPRQADVNVTVYDVEGRPVRTLLDGVLPAGPGKIAWDGTDANGYPVSSGVYFCTLRAGTESVTRKMTLLK